MFLFIPHHSFTQGNLQSEKITTLKVEEEVGGTCFGLIVERCQLSALIFP